MMRALIFAAALFAAGAAQAQERLELDPAHTQVGFTINRFGFNNVLARFETVAGEVVIDEANPQNSSVTATVQMASVSAGDATRDSHLRERWLKTAEFPTMQYQSTSVRVIDATHAEVTGNLTLLGQTHPLTLNVTLNRIGALPNNQRRAAGFSATGTLSRAAWGLTMATPLIGDEVRITIEALAVAPAAAAQ